MTSEALKKILREHKNWIDGLGKRADLQGVSLINVDLKNVELRYAFLRGADLRYANLQGANLRYADLQGANLRGANLLRADLRGATLLGANLQGTNLIDADLRNADLLEVDLLGANIDYSCLPLWCGSLSAHFDDRQLKQIAYHLVKAGLQSKNASEETKKELKKLVDFANGFHRVDFCGKIEVNKYDD